LPAGQWLNIELGNQLPDEGTMRVQVWAARTAVEEGRFPSLQLHFGWQASNEGRALLRVRQEDLQVQAEPGQFQVYQWDIPLGEIYPRNSVRKTSPLGATPSPSEYIRLVNSSASPDEIAIDFVSVEVPVFAQWPPASHRRVFPQPALANDDPLVSAHEILKSFMPRAWRRPVSDQEIQQKLQLFQRLRPDCNSFAEAMIEVLATVLAAPHFLYIGSVDSADPGTDPQDLEQRAKLSALELASRLSFFLWCSIPDDTLRQQAASGQLLNPDVLAAEIERMLADERADRFSQEFVRQWLDLQLLDHLDLRPHLPQFDPLLKDAMRHEPIALFQEMLVRNESVLNFVHADYTMANERLARHYGLSDVFGNHFRRVGLPDDFRRGGLLTQPGLLAMNSDYPDSHPLKRGIWLLESLLNDPPPPPPPAVPEIDLANPEIAKMTLLERIEDHRNHPACLSCHVKIDPWGIAFENYDAVGKWRDMVGDRPVEASSQLYNQQTLAGMDGLKRYLLASRQDQMVDALIERSWRPSQPKCAGKAMD
jgi:hypothetical protein